MAMVLYVLAEMVRKISLLLQAFIPTSAALLLDQLVVPGANRELANWDDMLEMGTAIPTPEGVFPRYVEAAA